MPLEVPPGPLPVGSRYVFTRDSILWSTSQTLADLLGAVPGVYVARAGFLGLPEYVVYGGRGAAAVELFWDGLPIFALGADSIYVDLGTFPLTYLRRVDVEVLPATLRVFIVSERHETMDARSVVRVMSGAFKTAAYTGLFQRRWPSGLGASVAANFGGTDGASGANRTDQAFDVWTRVEWMPTATAGAVYQFRRQEYDRDAVTEGRGGAALRAPVAARHGARSDYLFTAFAGTRPHGLGLRVEAGLGASAWTNDSVLGDRHVRQAWLGLSYRVSNLTVEARGRMADGRASSTLEGRLAWIPVQGIVVNGDARRRSHAAGRTSSEAHASLAIGRGPVALVGSLARGNALQAAALPSDSVQQTSDRAVHVRLTTAPLAVSLGLVTRDAYRPLPFPELPLLPAAGPSSRATYLVAEGRLQPVSALTVSGWYQDPRSGSADFQPPALARAQVTLRSKFWRTFRSGAFDLKVRFAIESWGEGTAGLSSTGEVIPLEAVTYQEWSVAFQIVGFTAFWDLRDAALAQKQYVPGLPYPHNAQVFGVRWEFSN